MRRNVMQCNVRNALHSPHRTAMQCISLSVCMPVCMHVCIYVRCMIMYVLVCSLLIARSCKALGKGSKTKAQAGLGNFGTSRSSAAVRRQSGPQAGQVAIPISGLRDLIDLRIPRFERQSKNSKMQDRFYFAGICWTVGFDCCICGM